MPRRAEKYHADDVRFSLGGGGAIAAVALQKMGAMVHLVGRLGDDMFADLVRGELTTRDIECSRIVKITGQKSTMSSIFIDANAERQIVNYRSSGNSIQLDIPDLLSLDSITAANSINAVLVDTRWEKAALYVLAYARDQQIPAVVDAEAPVCFKAMAMATHVAFSRQGLRDFAGTDDIHTGLRQAYEQFENWVCVTDGKQGVFYLHNGHVVQVPAFPIVPVDTLGAGDVWHAAFTLQLANNVTEHEAIVFANAAAALKCASTEGIDAAPDCATTMSLAGQYQQA